jgi:hypothetical protein
MVVVGDSDVVGTFVVAGTSMLDATVRVTLVVSATSPSPLEHAASRQTVATTSALPLRPIAKWYFVPIDS